jgi:hypothetical protein
MGLKKIPKPDELTIFWDEKVIGSESHKSWLLDRTLKMVRKIMSKDSFREEFLTRKQFNSLPITLPIYSDDKRYNTNLIFKDLQKVMNESDWEIGIVPVGPYNSYARLEIWPMNMAFEFNPLISTWQLKK